MKAFCFRFLRRLLCLLFLPLFCLAFSITVAAEEDAASAGSSLDELYEEQLEASGCPLLGVVLNKVKISENKSYGGYGQYYGHYGKYGEY